MYWADIAVKLRRKLEGSNGQIGYAMARDETDSWDYGLALTRPVNDRLNLMAEIYGDADKDFDDSNLAWLVGVDFAINEDNHFLFSIGTGIKDADDDDELDVAAFVGFQMFR